MKFYCELTSQELAREYQQVKESYENLKKKNMSLDMSRGKPSEEQLDMVSDILTVLTDRKDCFDGDIDIRNYGGGFAGIPSCRTLFAELLGTKPENVCVCGSASIYLMYDVVAKAYSHGLLNSPRPWSREEKVKFLCPVPGYDNHFRISEFFGAEMVNIPLTADGPDMDAVEEAVKDPTVKAMWCVPKYSNPSGIIYSEQTLRRLASLKPAAPDFTLLWDNAYCVHEFDGDYVPFPDILSLCAEAGNPDMVFEFASTSKMTMPGAGVAVFAANEDSFRHMLQLMSPELIGYDKVNMMRHVRYLQNKPKVLELMKRHAAILKPKFDVVADQLAAELDTRGLGRWVRPKGGYFISYDAMPGTAKRTLELCREAGVVMTTAGATFPYGVDPDDSNIRIAPSRPSVEELSQAAEIFCVCARLAALEKLQAN